MSGFPSLDAELTRIASRVERIGNALTLVPPGTAASPGYILKMLCIEHRINDASAQLLTAVVALHELREELRAEETSPQ
jgi:hypothetical protein